MMGFAFAVTDVEAKRVGGGKTSGASRPAATAAKPTPKVDEPDASASSSIRVPRVRVSSRSSSSSASSAAAAQPASGAVPAAAAGAAAGSAMAAPDPDAQRRQNEERLLRAAEEEEKRRALEDKRSAAIAAYEKEQQETRARDAKLTQEKEAHRQKLVRESRCQFKPVMTDDDIARCNAIYR